MAVAPVQKVQIVSFSGKKMDVLASLQEEGLIQIEDTGVEEWGLEIVSPDVSQLDHTLHRLSHALDFLSDWKEKGFGQGLFSPKPQITLKERESILKTDYPSILDKALYAD